MRTYLLISGIIFGLVAIAHLLRLALHWPLIVADWSVPQWVSVLGIIVPGVLCAWALRLRGGSAA
jgi:hypothetical protein